MKHRLSDVGAIKDGKLEWRRNGKSETVCIEWHRGGRSCLVPVCCWNSITYCDRVWLIQFRLFDDVFLSATKMFLIEMNQRCITLLWLYLWPLTGVHRALSAWSRIIERRSLNACKTEAMRHPTMHFTKRRAVEQHVALCDVIYGRFHSLLTLTQTNTLTRSATTSDATPNSRFWYFYDLSPDTHLVAVIWLLMWASRHRFSAAYRWPYSSSVLPFDSLNWCNPCWINFKSAFDEH